jgi:hypothetical protein
VNAVLLKPDLPLQVPNAQINGVRGMTAPGSVGGYGAARLRALYDLRLPAVAVVRKCSWRRHPGLGFRFFLNSPGWLCDRQDLGSR